MKKTFPPLCYSFFAFFGLLAIAHHNHIFLFILYGFSAIILFPSLITKVGINFSQRKGRRAFAVVGVVIYLVSIPLIIYYNRIDEQLSQRRQSEAIKLKQIIQQRGDSLSLYINQANKSKENKLDSALWYLAYGNQFSTRKVDSDKVHDLAIQITDKKIDFLMNRNNFKMARAFLDSLIQYDALNSNFFYKRAICYQKTGYVKAAVLDLKSAVDLGNLKANALFNKLNPIRKHIVGYITRCCDGSTSYATGRGACSHHGGVCNWNDPIYEERRQYE